MSIVMARPIDTTRGTGEPKPGPEEEWKRELRQRIENEFRPLIEEARAKREQRLREETSEEERKRIQEDFDAEMKSFRRLAEEQFREEEIRKMASRGKSGRQYSTSTSVQSQRDILAQIQRQRKPSDTGGKGPPAAAATGTVDLGDNEEAIALQSEVIEDPPAPGPSRFAQRELQSPEYFTDEPSSYSPPHFSTSRERAFVNPIQVPPRHHSYRVEDANDVDGDWQASPLPYSLPDYGTISRKQSNSSLASARMRQDSGRMSIPPVEYLPSPSRTMGMAAGVPPPSPYGSIRRSSNASIGSSRSGIAITAPRPSAPVPVPSHTPTPPPHSGMQYFDRHRDTFDDGSSHRGRERREDFRGYEMYSPDIFSEPVYAERPRKQSSASDMHTRRIDTRAYAIPSAMQPVSSPMSPELPRTPESLRQGSSYTSSHMRRPESSEPLDRAERGIPIPNAGRQQLPPQSSPEFPKGSPNSFGRRHRGSFTADDHPASSPRQFTAMRRQDSSGSRRSRRSVGPHSPRDQYSRGDVEVVYRRPLESYHEQSATDTDMSDDDGAFDVEALHWRNHEEYLKRQDEAMRHQQELIKKEQELERLREEARQKELEAERKETEARRLAEEAKRKEEEARLEAKRIEEEARRREDELRRKEEELRWREEELRRREEIARKENELKQRELELQRREAEAEARLREMEEKRRREQEEEENRKRREQEQEERRLAAEEEAKRRAEEDAKRLEEEERRHEEEARRKARVEQEELERTARLAELMEEERRLDEEKRLFAERAAEEERRQQLAEEERLRKAVEDQERKVARATERREAARREAQRQIEEEERKKAEEEEQRKSREAAARKRKEEEERKHKEAVEKAERERLEQEAAEKRKLAQEAERRRVAEQEAQKAAAAEAERQRMENERRIAEEKRRAEQERDREYAKQQAAARDAKAKEENRIRVKAQADKEREEREEEDRRLARQTQEEEDRRLAAQLDRMEKEDLMRQESARRASILAEQEARRRTQSPRTDDSFQGTRAPMSSASQAAASTQHSSPWTIPGHRQGSTASTSSTNSNSSDRTSATSSSWETNSSGWSGWSNLSGSTNTSASSRASTTPTESNQPKAPNTATPTTPSTPSHPKAAWRTTTPMKQHSTPASPSPSHHQPHRTNSRPEPKPESTFEQEERRWRERQAENFRRQQEKFQEQEAQAAHGRAKHEAQAVTGEAAVRIFEQDEQTWSRLGQDEVIWWTSLPWPMLRKPAKPEDITSSAIEAYVFHDHAPTTDRTTTRKDRLKDHIKRWHPDRFNSRYLGRVPESEKEKVRTGAAAVIQTLNELLNIPANQ